ncbi:MAG: zinc transporter ZupT [Candidatus Thermoplasmatota archaeon]
MFDQITVSSAFLLTILAGISTGIGSSIAYLIKKPKMIYLSFSLGFSAGVMIYVSFVELFPQSLQHVGEVLTIVSFLLGMLFIGFIDLAIPEKKNPHSYLNLSNSRLQTFDGRLKRTGIFTALAIAIHNFPEGLATFGTALSNIQLGVVIAVAIALHNIPEGISISIPVYYATHNKKKALTYSFLSGIAELVGAIVGYIILLPFLSTTVLFALLAFVAGIMIYISIDELLPIAHYYGYGHTVILGVILGMFIMALSLLFL